jgi:UDP-glucuronate 4-epimerase
MQKILVTGAAGFIGFSLCKELIHLGYDVFGLDNLNQYYDIELKKNRLKYLDEFKKDCDGSFTFHQFDLRNSPSEMIDLLPYYFTNIYHFAAQAGVRFSITNPDEYFSNNVTGTYNLLEYIKKTKNGKLVFSSTSSVYGDSKTYPQSESLALNPIQFYASTKAIGEEMCKMYVKIYGLEVCVFRFFTVYGPWGRPDMALFNFTKNISANKPIDIFNQGLHHRSFTYISDVTFYLVKYLEINLPNFSIFNLGNPQSVELKLLVDLIEMNLGVAAIKNNRSLQMGDVVRTHADITLLNSFFGRHEFTNLETGVKNFCDWFKSYSNIN